MLSWKFPESRVSRAHVLLAHDGNQTKTVQGKHRNRDGSAFMFVVQELGDESNSATATLFIGPAIILNDLPIQLTFTLQVECLHQDLRDW